jgi:hypothetical protein
MFETDFGSIAEDVLKRIGTTKGCSRFPVLLEPTGSRGFVSKKIGCKSWEGAKLNRR